MAVLWAALVVLASSTWTKAQDTSKINPIAFATILIEKGEPGAACSLLTAIFGVNTTNSRVLYLFGQCHLAQGQIEAGSRYYEQALRQEPQAVILRAELAGVYRALGRPEQARSLLAAATTADQTSKSAKRLASLALVTPQASGSQAIPLKEWSAGVSLGRIYDSNANGGPIASTVDAVIGGVPLSLAIHPSSRAAPDWGTHLAANASYTHPLDAYYALITRGDVSATFYGAVGQYSRQAIGAGVGIVYRGNQTSWSVVPNVRFKWQDAVTDEMQAAVDGRFNHRIDQALSIVGAGQVGYTAVPSDRSRDFWSGLMASGFNYAFNAQVEGGVQLVLRRAAGELSTEAYTSFGPEIYLSAALTDIMNVDITYSFTHIAYDQSLAMFAQDRGDNQHSLGVALNVDMSAWQDGLGGFARYNYSNTDSPISLYATSRHVVSTGFSYKF